MAQHQNFTGLNRDVLGNLLPYTDAASRGRLRVSSRQPWEGQNLCLPTADVFRSYRVDGSCPPYATDVNAVTGCCENTHASDQEFLDALQHGFLNIPSTASPPNATNLQAAAPDISRWFEHRVRNVAGVAPPVAQDLTLDITRPWLPLILKFYLLVEPTFIIRVRDNTNNVTHDVFNMSWELPVGDLNLRNILIRGIQEVGSNRNVEDGLLPAGFAPGQAILVPFAVRCRDYFYKPLGAVTVDIAQMDNIVSDPLCGHDGWLGMHFYTLAGVCAGGSYVDALVRILMAMNARQDIFSGRVSFALGQQLAAANAMTELPRVTNNISSSDVYLPVVAGVVAALAPQEWDSGRVDTYGAGYWKRQWDIKSDDHSRTLSLSVHSFGKIDLVLYSH